MKFLFSSLFSGGPHFYRVGLARALESCGHTVSWWNYAQYPDAALEVFEEIKPDVFFGTAYSDGLHRATKKAILKYNNCKVFLYAKTYGPSLELYDGTETFDIAGESDLRILDDISHRISFLTIHHHPDVVEQTLGWYVSKGIVDKIVGIGKAFDCITYNNGTFREELASDVAYIGGNWSIKSSGLNQYILPLCNPNSGLNVKIWGSGWGVVNCLGPIPEHLSASVWKSAKVCVNVSEPHSRRYGLDVIERPFKTIGVNGFCISDYVEAIKCYFRDDEIILSTSPRDFYDKVQHFVHSPQDREPYIRKGQSRIYAEHLYFDRVSQIFTELGFPKEAAHCLEVKKNWLTKNSP